MKNVSAVLIVVLMSFSLTQVAQASEEILRCGTNVGGGMISITVDSKNYEVGSGYKDVTDVRLVYLYSSVPQMACEGMILNNDYDVDCVGLYAGVREPTKLKLRTENSVIYAYWRTISDYNRKAMKTECHLL